MKITKDNQKVLKVTEEKGELLFYSPSAYIARLKEKGLNDHIVAYEKICEIAQVVKEAGGRAFLVGRDRPRRFL